MAGMDNDPLIDTDHGQRNLFLTAVLIQPPDTVNMKGHVLCQIIDGSLVGPCIQRITKSQQKTHRSGGGVITGQKRSADRNAIQNFNIEFSGHQCLYCKPHARH